MRGLSGGRPPCPSKRSSSTASGTGDAATPITAALDPVVVDALPNGTYTATLSLVPVKGTTVRIPATLTIARTQLDTVAPGIATAGVAGDVILRGQNLDQLTLEGLTFGDTPASAFQRTSSTELRATHPALAAGSYPVRLTTNLGTAHARPTTLTVVDAPSYGSAVLSYPTVGSPSFYDVAYDAPGRALLVGVQEGYDRKLLRYGYADGAGWSAATVDAFPSLEALAWTVDGQRLLVGSASGITEVDPATLARLGTTSVNGEYTSKLAVLNDGDVISFTGNPAWSGDFPFYRTSLQWHTWAQLPGMRFHHASMGTSGDGSRVVIGGTDDYRSWIYRYDASTRTLSSLGERAFGRTLITLDRTGSRTIMGTSGTTPTNGTWEVYDADLVLLGSLPGTTRAAVLNAAGTRAYTYEPSGADGTVRVFDLTQAPVASAFPELGTAVTLAGNPDVDGDSVKMLISADGGTLFLAGDDAVVVEPAPQR